MKCPKCGHKWDAPVPAPGTTWSVGEIRAYSDWWGDIEKIDDPEDGIAATTERNNKEKRT